jgi:hypothetical protein
MASYSKYRTDSFYSNTPMIDFYLDIWNDDVNISTAGDTVQEIPTRYHKRPDLWAYDLYQSPNYWWVFAVKNKDKLIDPVEDFEAGLHIIVPSMQGIRSLL